MKVLIVSTFEKCGGAARAAHRLYQKLQLLGLDSRMLVQYKQSDDSNVIASDMGLFKPFVKIRPFLDSVPLLFYRFHLSPPWSLAWLSSPIYETITSFAPDIIHLHGVGHGFLSLNNIKEIGAFPLVLSLHDSWAFTGGCHLPGSCNLYLEQCGKCPQLNSRHESDLSRWGWLRKSKMWPKLDVTFVAPSRWLAQSAQSSSLLGARNVEVIPNGIDTSHFSPADRAAARAELGLPLDGLILLYGAASFMQDKNKGFTLLKDALKLISSSFSQNSLTIVLFGDSRFRETEIAGIPVRSYGVISEDDKLVSLYRAADCFVLPSLQESLSFTVMESMACGTPCVAFNTGGVGELLSHAVNGYFAATGSIQELAEGIIWMLAESNRRTKLGSHARKTIEDRFSLHSVAKQYLALYESVLANKQMSVC